MKEVVQGWLSEKVPIVETEAANMADGRPFGHQHRKWERLKQQMVEGDELWEFSSPPESWAHRMGRQGYAVVRNGNVVDFLMTTCG